MLAQSSTSASILSQLPITEKQYAPQGYYRSKLFIASSSSNPLIAVAGPIFSLLERLGTSQTMPTIEDMSENIEHEINAFHTRLISLEYNNELILIARYLLSATIDEILGKNYLRINGEPAEFKAFTQYANDQVGPQQRFFEIVDYVKERPSQYLDFIELAYYCLIAGFEGQYHLKPNGRQQLDNTIEELFQLIQSNRAHKPLKLFKEKSCDSSKQNHNKPLLFAGLLAAGLLTIFYLFSHTILEHKAKRVLTNHSVLASVDHSWTNH